MHLELQPVFGQQSKDIARQNEAIARQNQLAINAYNTKNRNAKLAWLNDKKDSDIEVNNKWQEAIDRIAQSQIEAKEVAGKSAIAQQQILTKIINAQAAKEQTGRRTGRGNIAQLGAESGAAAAAAVLSKKSAILYRSSVNRELDRFAQGKYVEYITGRPSPAAPPVLEKFRKGPSFLNTALSIAGAGLNRYNQYQENTNKPGWNNVLQPPNQNQQQGNGLQTMPWTPSKNSPSISGQLTTMELPSYSSPTNIFGQNSQLQGELDNYFNTKTTTNFANNLGISYQDTFGVGE